ncbi:hypothetical protein WME98_24090 [Sorangium sp. So ce296]|uniref:hypothetical protein n=1 Tax=Sorangium sp. So ce296 TaxID=3133296 RepID=UPI003F615108
MKRSDKKRRTRALPAAELRLPKALYTSGWSEIVELWHKKAAPEPPGTLEAVRMAMAIEGLRTAEALVISPAVCNHVYGENVVLCRLIDGFGIAGVEQLLEEGALQFLLWRPMILYWNKGQLIDAQIDPLTSGNFETPAHSDPQASVEMGLKGGWLDQAWPKVERLAKLAIERTHLPAQNVSHDAVAAVRVAYDSGALRRHGFDPSRPRWELDDDERARLVRIAEDIAKGVVLYDCEFDFHESGASWEQLLRFREIVRAPNAARAVERGLMLEGVPSVPALITSGAIGIKEIAKLRNHPATQELRKWLWSQPDPRDAESVARAWLSQMTTTPLKDRKWFKAVRLTTFSVLGGVLGAVVGGPPAILAGTAVGTGLNQALGMLDSYGLEKLLTRPGPRRFAELVRAQAAQHAQGRQTGNRKARRATAAKAGRQ